MQFEWDDSKSLRNLHDRGFDFAFAASIFDGPTVVRADHRRDYGEPWLIAIGMAGGEALAVVFTDRATGRRIISARRAKRRERDAYRAAWP